MELSQAIAYVRDGGVIAYPTETVWGLGALNSRPEALNQLLKIKGRDISKGVSLLVANIEMAEELAFIEDSRIKTFLQIGWPGPLTVVLKAKGVVHPLVHGGTGEVGLRLSSHPLIQKLMDGLWEPLTTTSANLSGQPPARSATDLAWLPPTVGVVGGTEAEGLEPSTVIRIYEGKITLLRNGAIDLGELELMARTCELSIH